MRKNLNIECLRGIAIFLVLITHTYFFPYILYINQLFDFGRGVDLFFVISGFLMGSTYIAKISILDFDVKSAYNFYVKRISRLFPAVLFWNIFTVIIGVFFLKHTLFPNNYRLIASVLSNITFIGNFFNYQYENGLGYWWSIGLEFQFYILLPIILYLSGKYFWKVMVIITLMLSWDKLWTIDHVWLFRINSLFFGLLTWKITSNKNFGKIKERINNLSTIKINLIIFFMLLSILLNTKILSDFYVFMNVYASILFSLCMLIAVARENYIFNYINYFFIFLGKISYSVYLSHILIYMICTNIFQKLQLDNYTIFYILIYPIVIIVGYLSFKYIEPLMIKEKYMIK
ncbi:MULTISPECIES: acyltransferase [unclassified Commensalibacter]|uniref:acyltransferase family protein n=1 Tax=unclassified Commensalibacter TaxID=2630218 RepID=UPI0018DC0A4A|nr:MULTISPECIES: acyltransferase [unclassified Commensalibacter]MBH9969766.1 acyltransferase [Commensalibacter sp. M0265]MBH9977338.1 acyltransferase [Commensalibacter sp. M0266]MBH9992801.1 acyltransferase [Commensalibacter sp. M0270]MBI0046514.1 acyltransferase [Commensalibacter sp. M0267]MBI0055966.1 acyltransferase [Commensalibacter sp. M0268]